MVITVKCSAAQWSLVDPAMGGTEVFNSGAAAFDVAVERAGDHHRHTGQRSAVRVEALGNCIEAVHFEAATPLPVQLTVPDPVTAL